MLFSFPEHPTLPSIRIKIREKKSLRSYFQALICKKHGRKWPDLVVKEGTKKERKVMQNRTTLGTHGGEESRVRLWGENGRNGRKEELTQKEGYHR